MVYDALSRNCYRVFTPIQFKFSRSDNPQLQDIPNGSSCSGGSDSCTFPPYSSPTGPGQRKALAEFPETHPFPVQKRSNSQNLGRRQQTWSPTGVTSQLLVKRKLIRDLQELMAKLSLPSTGADSIWLLCSPSPAGNCPGRTPLKSLGLFAFGGFLSLKIKINPSTWLELWALNQYS